ncbi:MAG: Ada metal-binding domain-containing protein [Methanothrix sp.]|uniref:Ada metal-binding domain-containing protein n=1 Tax=Methanothrix sp. TaxID=90426 RepID=UPI0032AF78D3|nr:Ada metal-binding domain-containing protein [Methanothrix sp.]
MDQNSLVEVHAERNLELEFEPGVSRELFLVRGTLELVSNISEPYLLLEAHLLREGQEVLRSRYLLIDVAPGQTAFEFSKIARLHPGRGYTCRLVVSGADGTILSAERAVQILESTQERSIYPPSLSLSEPAGASGGNEGVSTEGGDEQSDVREKDTEDTGAGLNVTGGSAKPERDGTKQYVGSTTSRKYHLPECRYAKKIKPEHVVIFSSKEEAESRGYEPCRVCNP